MHVQSSLVHQLSSETQVVEQSHGHRHYQCPPGHLEDPRKIWPSIPVTPFQYLKGKSFDLKLRLK